MRKAGPAPLKPEDQIRLAYAVGYMDGIVNEYSLVFGDRNVPLSEAVERYMATLKPISPGEPVI